MKQKENLKRENKFSCEELIFSLYLAALEDLTTNKTKERESLEVI